MAEVPPENSVFATATFSEYQCFVGGNLKHSTLPYAFMQRSMLSTAVCSRLRIHRSAKPSLDRSDGSTSLNGLALRSYQEPHPNERQHQQQPPAIGNTSSPQGWTVRTW